MAETYLGVGIDASKAQVGANQFESATNKVKKGAKGATDATEQFKAELSKAKAMLIAAGAAATYFAIRTISEYTKALSAAQAVTGATTAQMKQLETATRQLGATTQFSAAQAADAVKFLGMAGFETNEILEALPATLDLAAAAGLQMGQAADIASNIMSGFNIEASKMSEVADTLAAVAANANTDVTGMGEAMKYVGPIARSVGITMQDTAAAVGVLANAGIQGSMAGTSLKTSLSALVNPSKLAMKAIESLGLTLDQLNPQTNEFKDVVKLLADAGLDAERSFQIFGQRGATAMLALTANVPQLERLTEVTNNASGEAERMAKIMRDNLAGDAQILWSAISELALVIGEMGLTDAIRQMLQSGTKAVAWLTEMIKSIKEATGWTKLFIIGLESIAVAIGAIMALKLAVWIWGVTKAALAMSAAFLATPFGMMVAGIGLLVGSIYLLATSWENLPALIGKSGNDILLQINIIGAKALIYIRNLMATIWDMGGKWALEFGTNIKDVFVNAWRGGASFAKKELVKSMDLLFSDAIKEMSIPENVMNEMLRDNFSIDINRMAEDKKGEARSGGILLAKNMIDGFSSITKDGLLSAAASFIPGGNRLLGLTPDISAPTPNIPKLSDTTSPKTSSLYTGDSILPMGYIASLKKETDATVELMKANNDLIVSLDDRLAKEQFKNDLVKEFGGDMEKVNLEMQIYGEQQKLNVLGDEQHNKEIREKITQINELKKATDKATSAKRKQQQAEQEWAREMTSAFKDAIMNSKNLGDALSNLANKVQNMLVNKALDSLIGGLFSGFAKGAAFSGGRVTAYASGGIVDSPTIFPMANGMGLMGEAGPEAVMPLGRTASGDLGVKMVNGGGGSVVMNNVFNIDVSGGNEEQNNDAANTVSRQIRREMDDLIMKVIIREKRNGGALR